ncbi:MAG: hypothetical protein IPJ58_15165 [Ardenticatenia bacterium]|nr:hypothetical protein [Ardenticatenia bacterium]
MCHARFRSPGPYAAADVPRRLESGAGSWRGTVRRFLVRRFLPALGLLTLIAVGGCSGHRGEAPGRRPGDRSVFERNGSEREVGDANADIADADVVEADERAPDVWLRQVHGEVSAAAMAAGLAGQRQAAPLLRAAGLGALAELRWTWRGPDNVAGRANGLAFDPVDPRRIYLSTDSGGLWKSMDAGVHWRSLSDSFPSQAMGGVALDPTRPGLVYAATSSYRSWQGAGVLRSRDGGDSWELLATTAVNADWRRVHGLWVDAGGALWAATGSGLWQSADQGESWERRIDQELWTLAFQPSDPRVLLAGGNAPAVWRSADGGATWTVVALPAGEGGSKVAVAFAADAPAVAYALYRGPDAARLWRSRDGGGGFTAVKSDLSGQMSNYALALWVDPADAEHLLVGGVNLWRSRDGGAHFKPAFDSTSPIQKENFWDLTGIVSHPAYDGGANRGVYVTHDSGLRFTADIATAHEGADWQALNQGLGTVQFYGVDAADKNGALMGGTQDNATKFSPDGGLSWREMTPGGDGTRPVLDDGSTWAFGSYQLLSVFRGRSDGKDYSFEFIMNGLEEKGGANFMPPLAADPTDADTLLAGGAAVWRSRNVRGPRPTWSRIKEPLSAATDCGPGDCVSAIAVAAGDVSATDADQLWVGHNNGRLFHSADGRALRPIWQEVDGAGILPGRLITRIRVDPTDARRVTVAYGGVGVNLYQTEDGGAVWRAVAGSDEAALPQVAVHDVVSDPSEPRLRWAATDLGVYVSADDGERWLGFNAGMPVMPVTSLAWAGRTLVAGTFGRGAYSVDLPPDLAPLPTRTPGPTPTGAPRCSTSAGGAGILVFDNRRRQAVTTHWVDFGCKEVVYATIPGGKSQRQGTYVGHVWRVRDAASGELLAEVVAEAGELTVILEDSPPTATPPPSTVTPQPSRTPSPTPAPSQSPTPPATVSPGPPACYLPALAAGSS